MICTKELKEKTLSQLKNNWGFAILICLIYTIISNLINLDYRWEYSIKGVDFYIAIDILLIIILGPFQLGFSKFILNFIEDKSKASFKDLFYGFTSIKLLITSCTINLIIITGTVIGTILLIVPGIIWAFAFSQTYFVLIDNPKMKLMECLRKSYNLMDGFKGELFMLELSFIGWVIVCVLTLGIGLLWYIPYHEITLGNFYMEIKEIKKNTDTNILKNN